MISHNKLLIPPECLYSFFVLGVLVLMSIDDIDHIDLLNYRIIYYNYIDISVLLR